MALLLGFSLGTRHFATFGNMLAMLHTMAPLLVMSGALALVVLAGKLDISIENLVRMTSIIEAPL